MIGASSGLLGAVWAQSDLHKVLEHIEANVIEGESALGQAGEAFDEDEFLDPGLEENLEALTTKAVSELFVPVPC